jgi:hypothetical protein
MVHYLGLSMTGTPFAGLGVSPCPHLPLNILKVPVLQHVKISERAEQATNELLLISPIGYSNLYTKLLVGLMDPNGPLLQSRKGLFE